MAQYTIIFVQAAVDMEDFKLGKKQQVELNAFPNKVFGTRSFASD